MNSYGLPLIYWVTNSPNSKFMLDEKSEPRTNHITSCKSPTPCCKSHFEQMTLTGCLKCWILTILSRKQLKLSILRKWDTFPSWLSVLSCSTQIDNAKLTNLLLFFFIWNMHSSLLIFHLVQGNYNCSRYRKITCMCISLYSLHFLTNIQDSLSILHILLCTLKVI